MKKHKPYCKFLQNGIKCTCRKKLVKTKSKPAFKIGPAPLPTRGYFLVNQYISGIQCGIQTAHCALALTTNRNWDNLRIDNPSFFRWLHYDKTMIVLNGGYQNNLEEIYLTICNYNKFIFHRQPQDEIHLAKFHEEQEALNGALTCVGFVLPGWMIEIAKHLKDNKVIFIPGGIKPAETNGNQYKITFEYGISRMFMPGSTRQEGLTTDYYSISKDLISLLIKLNSLSSAR